MRFPGNKFDFRKKNMLPSLVAGKQKILQLS
jgi:hypothetical protein